MKTKGYLPSISILAFITLITFLPPSPATAAETAEGVIVPCNVYCYVIEEDPAGVKVRSGPGTQYPVVTTLPTDPTAFVSAVITGSQGKWLRVEDIYVGTRGEIHPYLPESGHLYLTGWVSGPVFGTETVCAEANGLVPLYEEPGTGSSVLTRILTDIEVPVIGGRGEWLKVRYRGVEGWLAPRTCDEVWSD